MNKIYLFRVMRLLMLFTLVGLMHVSAASYSQTVTLHGENLSLVDVFRAVRQQTGYAVYGYAASMKDAKLVSIDAEGMPLGVFLSQVLENQPVDFEIEGKTIVIKQHQPSSSLALAYPEVRGRVVDSLGNPLQGASIRVLNAVGKRTILQATTDDDGYFTLRNVPEEASLEITYVGYVKQTVAAQAEVGPVMLKAVSSELEEVEVMVNTGYQNLPKERATGSFEVVDNELFNRQIGTDVISRLDGIMPSVFFDKRGGSERDMIIRGVGTLGLTDRRPLVIIDNFPFEGDIQSINPNDVESITLLKDAAAASIWGAKAGNGVLVITTKHGKFNSPWRFSVTANNTITEKPDLYYQSQITSSEFIDVEQFLYEQGVFNSALNNVTSRPPVTPVVELLHKHKNGSLSDQGLDAQLDIYRSRDLRQDLTEYFYRTGINQQYALSLNGGGEKYNTMFSLGYDRNSSTSVGNDFSRVNLHLQNAFRPLDKLELNVGLRYSLLQRTNNHLGSIKMVFNRDLYPYGKLIDEHGQALAVEKDYRSGYLDDVQSAGQLLDWRYRPYEELSLADNTNQSNNMLFTAKAKYDFFKGFSGELLYQYEYQPTTDRQHFSQDTYYTRNQINRFTQVDGATIVRQVPLGGILDRSYSDQKAHSARGQLNFNHTWSKHSVSAISGMELRHAEDNGNNTRLYGYDDELLTNIMVNAVDRLPTYDNLTNGSTILYPNGEFGTVQRFVSLYGNMAYSYNGRYTLSVSARRDASNLFGVETNNKWTPLWSVGGLWDIGKESFYQVAGIPVLKFRATYGSSGNVAAGLAGVTTLDYRGTSRIGRFPYAIVNNPPNPQLRWERVSTLNLGLDFGLTKSCLSGSIEYYRKISSDVIAIIDSDPTTGFNFLARNSATLRNEGVDLSLASRELSLGPMKWASNFLLSVNKNTVVAYMYTITRPSSQVGPGINISPMVGQPAFPLVSYRWGGLDPETGNPIGFVNGEQSTDYALIRQQATQGDLEYHGSALPEYFGAFRNSLSWKGLSLSVNLTYRAGYYFRRETIDYAMLLSANAEVGHGDYTNRWQKPGDEQYTTIPSMVYPTDSRRDELYKESEITAERGDHIRLQDASLSYSFMKTKNLPFRDLKATLYARNLGVLWKSTKYDLDPDVRQLPFSRSLALGLTINF